MSDSSPHDLSFKARPALKEVGEGSCYYCLKTFSYYVIENWADDGQTAICPYCNIDSVVPGKVDMVTLEKWREQFFDSIT